MMAKNSTPFHAIPPHVIAGNAQPIKDSTHSTPKRACAHVNANVNTSRLAHNFSRACTKYPCTPWNEWNTRVSGAFLKIHGVECRGKPETNPMTKPLRQSMPETAAFIDAFRDAFGPATINAAIKAGIDGQPTFYASENGQEIGTRAPYSAEKAVSLADTLVGPFNPANAPQKRNLKG